MGRNRRTLDTARQTARLPAWGTACLWALREAPLAGVQHIVRTLEFLLSIAKERLEDLQNDGAESHEGHEGQEATAEACEKGCKRGFEASCDPDPDEDNRGWNDHWT